MIYRSLLKEYKTPFYLYDLNVIRESYIELAASLPVNSQIYYSIKANPHPKIVKELYTMGAGIEVSSIGELKLAKELGVNRKKIIYTGPAKKYEELEYIVQNKASLISVESINELEKLSLITKKYKKTINILIRINSSSQILNVGLAMSGKPSQFGLDTVHFKRFISKLKENAYIKLIGFHFFDGTNIQNEDIILNNFINALRFVKKVVDEFNLDISIIDLGGGFGAPFASNEKKPKYKSIKSVIEKEMENIFSPDKQPSLIFESGRYLVGDSGKFFTSIIDVKESKGENFIVLDSGINHLSGMSGIGRLPRIKLELNMLAENDSEPKKYTVVGPLCTPLDLFVKNKILKGPKIGDVFVVNNVGAYGLTASLIAFLSHNPPIEIVIDNNKVKDISTIKIIREGLN